MAEEGEREICSSLLRWVDKVVGMRMERVLQQRWTIIGHNGHRFEWRDVPAFPSEEAANA